MNLMAVVEFLENVDLEALGLGPSDRVISVETLSPIPLDVPTSPIMTSIPARFRGKVGQQVGELTTSANKVIFGVVDSSFSALRGLLSEQDKLGPETAAAAILTTPWQAGKVGFGLLKRGTGFAAANLPSSLTGGTKKSEEEGKQLEEVSSSRPASIRDFRDNRSDSADSDSEGDDERPGSDDEHHPAADARSIRSFSSMMSKDSKLGRRDRLSIGDRLASMSAQINKPSPPTRVSLLPSPEKQPSALQLETHSSHSRSTSPSKIPPPKQRFLECSSQDLRISEVDELLSEYRRMVEAVRALGGFTQP
jgi:hypothetical protein